jgi:hypothetical protein
MIVYLQKSEEGDRVELHEGRGVVEKCNSNEKNRIKVTVNAMGQGTLMTIGRFPHQQASDISLFGPAAITRAYTKEQFKMIMENSITMLDIDATEETFKISSVNYEFLKDTSIIVENANALKEAMNEMNLALR